MDIKQALARAEYFKGNPSYLPTIKTAKALYARGLVKESLEELKALPTDEQLFDTLLKKLEGKSVFKNLKRLAEGKTEDKLQYSISCASMLVHILLETREKPEYKLLVESTLSKLYQSL